uniref:Uncharacterized protein n=1 Tax=Oryza punctata TaxID=4537 RepID=A0A0E0KYB0_ORYPU
MDSSAADGETEESKVNTTLPEDSLNIVLLCTAFFYKAMNTIGTLATIWATVVLLGGFSTLIKKQDFWYVTVIAFVQSIGYTEDVPSPYEHKEKIEQIYMEVSGNINWRG